VQQLHRHPRSNFYLCNLSKLTVSRTYPVQGVAHHFAHPYLFLCFVKLAGKVKYPRSGCRAPDSDGMDMRLPPICTVKVVGLCPRWDIY
jgi:hypothetical protein